MEISNVLRSKTFTGYMWSFSLETSLLSVI